MFPLPYITLFSFPNITLVFSLFVFNTRVLNPGTFSFNTDANSFKYGNFFPFATNTTITSFVLNPTLVTKCLKTPVCVFSSYKLTSYAFI